MTQNLTCMVFLLDNIAHQTSERLTWEMMIPRMWVRQRRLGSAWSCKYSYECDTWWPQSYSLMVTPIALTQSWSPGVWRLTELCQRSLTWSQHRETRRRNFGSWTLGTLGMTRGISGLSSIQSFQKWTASIKFQFTWIVWACTSCTMYMHTHVSSPAGHWEPGGLCLDNGRQYLQEKEELPSPNTCKIFRHLVDGLKPY